MVFAKRGIIMKRQDGSEIVNYNDESFPSYIHDGYIYPGCSWERVPHYHEDVEFISVYSGEMGYSVGGVNLTLKKGDTLFVNSEKIHYSFSTVDRVTSYYIAVMHPRIICSSFIDIFNPSSLLLIARAVQATSRLCAPTVVLS